MYKCDKKKKCFCRFRFLSCLKIGSDENVSKQDNIVLTIVGIFYSKKAS